MYVSLSCSFTFSRLVPSYAMDGILEMERFANP